MRIVLVQYGDYRTAVANFASGGEETYAAQRYSVNSVANLCGTAELVCVICVDAEPHEELLSNGVKSIGLRLYSDTSVAELIQRVAAQRPTHLVSRSPIRTLIRWGVDNGVRTFPCLATSFPKGSLRTAFRNFRVARALRDPRISFVGNHSTNSCLDLARIGVPRHKIVPWDWPPMATPNEYPAKTARADTAAVRLFFAGVVSEDKGVGDCIEAVKRLRERGMAAELTIAGSGEIDRFRSRAEELGLAASVHFLGRIPHRQVVRLMHEHDVCLVPSRHTYPEGLPLTIYDTYCSRSPLVASDHPMFRGRVKEGEAALIFRGGDPDSLAARIEELARDPALYTRLSLASADAWARLQLPVRWADLLGRWLDDSTESRAWLTAHSLASGRY